MPLPPRPPRQRAHLRRAPSALPLALLLLALLGLPHAAHGAPGEDADVRLLEGWRYRWGAGPQGLRGVPAWAQESGDGADWLPTEALRTPPGRDGQRLLWLSIPIP